MSIICLCFLCRRFAEYLYLLIGHVHESSELILAEEGTSDATEGAVYEVIHVTLCTVTTKEHCFLEMLLLYDIISR